MSRETSPRTPAAPHVPPETLAAVGQALQGLRYGVVTIIVQDGVVVQVERTEKRRLRGPRETGE